MHKPGLFLVRTHALITHLYKALLFVALAHIFLTDYTWMQVKFSRPPWKSEFTLTGISTHNK